MAVKKNPKKRMGRGAGVLMGLALLLVLGFVFCCSGLPFPMFAARSGLERIFKEQLKVSLPASATVEHATSIAHRDGLDFYQLHMSKADSAAVLADLRSSSRDANDRDEWYRPYQPGWFQPHSIPNIEKLTIWAYDNKPADPYGHRTVVRSYDIYYAPDTDQFFIESHGF